MSGMAEPILEELSGRVLTLTINRPERLNAIDYDTALLLGEALERAESDASVSAVILTGAGERAFCAGQDLKSLAESGKSALVRGGWGGVTERSFSKPLIAAVNGLALGGGMELALSCDITLASETARFALPEVRRGLFPVGGGAVRLARTLPRPRHHRRGAGRGGSPAPRARERGDAALRPAAGGHGARPADLRKRSTVCQIRKEALLRRAGHAPA